MTALWDYVGAHTVRGACTCGKCIDSPVTDHPEKAGEYQPKGHTADIHFFKVAMREDPKLEDFLALVKAEHPHWLDGKEHNYLEMGADMGDQGIALVTMGLGSLLGAWHLMTPEMFFKGIPKEMADQMAGVGLISIRTTKWKLGDIGTVKV